MQMNTFQSKLLYFVKGIFHQICITINFTFDEKLWVYADFLLVLFCTFWKVALTPRIFLRNRVVIKFEYFTPRTTIKLTSNPVHYIPYLLHYLLMQL